MAGRRETFTTGSDKRYVRRDASGRYVEVISGKSGSGKGGSSGVNYRSSKTGQYTTKKKAQGSPSTHEKEKKK